MRLKFKKRILESAFRYGIAVVVGLFISIFYLIFTPLTMLFLSSMLKLLFSIKVFSNFIFYNGIAIEIIPACIGGSAYYLLFLLNILTPQIKSRTRLYAFIFSAALFFIFNLLRLFILVSLEFSNINTYFYHKLFWYLGSTLFVFFIWIASIKIFKIKEIPVVSDFIWLIKSKKSAK